MSNVGSDQRTYGQWCPIAVGLDIVGDRWTLLICRELSFGDARFTDLRTNLPGIAPNLLSDRLRALQAHGLVESVELPPPAARSVYRLTAEGRSNVVPVLRALARLGAPHLDGDPRDSMNARRVAHALLAPWFRTAERPVRVRLVLAPSADAVDLVAGPDGLEIADPLGEADAVIETTAAELAAARRTGELHGVTMRGSVADRELAMRAFGLRRSRAGRANSSPG